MPERDRLRMHAVGPAHAQRLPVLKGPPPHHREEPFELGEDQVRGLTELQGQRRVEQVARGEAEVDPPPGRPDRLRGRLDERGHVVAGDPLELLDALWGGRDRPGPDLRQVLLRDPADPGPALAGQHLDAEPVLELSFFGPHRGHLGKRVPADHARKPSARESLNSCRRCRVSSSRTETICAAKIAAFTAPSMAMVATGTPRGIWTVE